MINVNEIEELEYTVEPPFLSPIRDYEYTLVLDLDETLVHYIEEENTAYVQIRPGAEHFLKEMSRHFEIVIFTAAMSDVIIHKLVCRFSS